MDQAYSNSKKHRDLLKIKFNNYKSHLYNYIGNLTLSLLSHREWSTICIKSKRFEGRLITKCLFTSKTRLCFSRYSSIGIAFSISLISAILATGTWTENRLQSSTSANGNAYPSETTTGTHPACIDSIILGLATSYPLGHRQNLDLDIRSK